MIKIGTYKARNNEYSPEELLRMTKDAGFDFVCFAARCLYPGDNTGYTPELCAKVGIGFDNVHLTSNGAHALWLDGEDGDAIVDRYCREIEMSATQGIKIGITHVTWGTSTPPPIGELGIKRLSRVVEVAEKHSFTVALENSAFPAFLHYSLDKLKSPYIGFCFDSGHRNAFAPNEDFLKQYGHILAATHMADNEGKTDLHLIPGDGNADFDKVTSELALTALGRDRICAEPGSIVHRERPGMSRKEIQNSLSSISLMSDPDCDKLLNIYDGGFTVYENLSYPEYLARLAKSMKKLALTIESKI